MEQRKTSEETSTCDGCGRGGGGGVGDDKQHLILVPCNKGTNE